MPPLDAATLNAVLQKQGMPNTTENLNRIAQFAAVAPDMLAQYLGQGTDVAAAAGGGTDAAVNRSMNATDPRLAELAGPNPLSVTLDPNTGMSNVGPGLVNTPEPTGRGNGGGRMPPRRGVAPPTEPPPGSVPTPKGGSGATAPAPDRVTMRPRGSEVIEQTPGMQLPTTPNDSWSDYLMISILGPAAYAAWKARGGAAAPTPAPNVPTQALPNPQVPPTQQLPAPNASNRPPVDNSGAPPPPPPRQAGQPMQPGPGQTPADVARLQGEVDAENARGAAQLQQQIKQKAAQDNTRKTLEAGKRVFTGGRK